LLIRVRIEPLAITLDYALLAGSMKHAHRDPFDRMIIAQARLRNIAIITNDPAFHGFDADVIW